MVVQSKEYTGYVVWVNVPNSIPHPIEWYCAAVQEKAMLLLAAMDDHGESYIEGVGAIGPECYASKDHTGLSRIIHIYATNGD